MTKKELNTGEYIVPEHKCVEGPFASSILESLVEDTSKFTSSEACDEVEDFLDAGRYSNKNQ